MAFGFPAYHTAQYSTKGDRKSELHTAVHAALAALSWSVKEETVDGLLASTSINLRSWGERVLILFKSDHSISVTSQCALPTQCFDWGKNKANVKKFLAEIAKHS